MARANGDPGVIASFRGGLEAGLLHVADSESREYFDAEDCASGFVVGRTFVIVGVASFVDDLVEALGWLRSSGNRQGRLLLAGSSQASGTQWTDNGQYHQSRSLKARADGVKRPVPACPELVVNVRAHVAEFDASDDGRLFRSQRGNRLARSVMSLFGGGLVNMS